MAHRKKPGELKESEVECYYCNAAIPESSLRCPSCGKLFSAAKRMMVMSVVAIIIIASLGYLAYSEFYGGQESYNNGLNPNPNPNPSDTNRFVNIQTQYGTIKIEMYEDTAPVTAGHFIELVHNGQLSAGMFYRAEPGFVLQGGLQSGSSDTVTWEDNGLLNKQWTISMARSDDPSDSDPTAHNTGSSEFFINLVDNPTLDSYDYYYVVFGKVVSGTNIVSQISGLPSHSEGGLQILDNPVQFQSISLSDT
jgi:cyclophilin family peptidyl-prolyl cis-trans isomerase